MGRSSTGRLVAGALPARLAAGFPVSRIVVVARLVVAARRFAVGTTGTALSAITGSIAIAAPGTLAVTGKGFPALVAFGPGIERLAAPGLVAP
jgi:hypothetical protein